jgi:hypothetical protein
MKRILGVFLLSLLMLTISLSGMAATSLPVAGMSGFSIEGDIAMTALAQDMRAAAPVKAMEELLLAAKAPATPPEKPRKVAVLTIEFAESDRADIQYDIVLEGEKLFLRQSGQLLELDTAAFHRVLDSFGNRLYRYRALPTASLTEGTYNSGPLFVEKTTYAYKKLDNRFYYPNFSQDGNGKTGLLSASPWPTLTFSRKPESHSVSVYGDSKTPLFTGTWQEAGDYLAAKTGMHTVEITAIYQQELYMGDITYSFTVEEEKPASDFSIEGNTTYPGEVMVLRVHNAGAGDKVQFSSDMNFTPNFFDDGQGGKIALMPVSYFTGVGEHAISLTCGGKSVTWGITVNDKKFQIQNLTVDATTTAETIASQAANNEYENAIAPLRFVADSTRHWDSFMWPLTGRVTTEFGMIRYTNGQPTSSRHGAIDFAAPKGTPVKATANGRVLYAGYLQLTGNTVLIEHGYGLKSWYYHMDSLGVKTGDMVEMFQEIGKVGSTGFSTGAHLHFGMSVNNVFVNPTTVVDTELLK